MTSRIWDPQGAFAHLVLKDYTHWSLELNARQRTLGAFLIFSKRKTNTFSSLEPNEALELLQIMRAMESALKEAFHPDRFNYLQLGNELDHLHIHGYPRYAAARTFAGKIWEDKTFSAWPSNAREAAPDDVLMALKKAIPLSPISKPTLPS